MNSTAETSPAVSQQLNLFVDFQQYKLTITTKMYKYH